MRGAGTTPFHEGDRIRRAARASIVACACLLACVPAAAQEPPKPPAAQSQQDLTVDSLSVVRVRAKALSNARSMRTLGPQREGSGVVIDAKGLVLTIGYLILEAETWSCRPRTAGRFPPPSSPTTTIPASACCAP